MVTYSAVLVVVKSQFGDFNVCPILLEIICRP